MTPCPRHGRIEEREFGNSILSWDRLGWGLEIGWFAAQFTHKPIPRAGLVRLRGARGATFEILEHGCPACMVLK